jgi:hypothetical protein
MIGLIVRLLILFGVVVGVTYAATRKLKGRKEQSRLESIESDLRALRADDEVGVLSDAERAELLAKVEAATRALGGATP